MLARRLLELTFRLDRSCAALQEQVDAATEQREAQTMELQSVEATLALRTSQLEEAKENDEDPRRVRTLEKDIRELRDRETRLKSALEQTAQRRTESLVQKFQIAQARAQMDPEMRAARARHVHRRCPR